MSSEATYPEDLPASHAQCLAAKAPIDEIAASGTDVQLQGHSDYSGTKLRVEVWESNRDRVTQSFTDTAREYTVKNAFRQQEWLNKADLWLAKGDGPDFDTIARFRKEKWELLRRAFAESVRLCTRAGLVLLESSSIDGTKIKANASRTSLVVAEALRAIEEILRKAEAASLGD